MANGFVWLVELALAAGRWLQKGAKSYVGPRLGPALQCDATIATALASGARLGVALTSAALVLSVAQLARCVCSELLTFQSKKTAAKFVSQKRALLFAQTLRCCSLARSLRDSNAMPASAADPTGAARAHCLPPSRKCAPSTRWSQLVRASGPLAHSSAPLVSRFLARAAAMSLQTLKKGKEDASRPRRARTSRVHSYDDRSAWRAGVVVARRDHRTRRARAHLGRHYAENIPAP